MREVCRYLEEEKSKKENKGRVLEVGACPVFKEQQGGIQGLEYGSR